MTPTDIETLERATLAAISPEAVEEMNGWLLPFDSGKISRARSAVPLAHGFADAAVIGLIEARYRRRGLSPVFRMPSAPCFDELRHELKRRAYTTEREVLVQVAPSRTVRRVCAMPRADLADVPDAAWAALFLDKGVDPVDGANRVRSLARAPGSLFASCVEHGQTAAAGAGAFSHGWASVHGMRTAPASRGKGFASQVLAALAQAALDKGLERMFLQVEEQNIAAQSLYRRAGFETKWRYAYWRAGKADQSAT